MNIDEIIAQEPEYIKKSSAVQLMVQIIQQQDEKVQQQAEEIQQLKKTVSDLKDEINRLKKIPKRPKLHPNKLEPRRSNKKSINKASLGFDKNICAPIKKQETIKIEAKEVPFGSRFKGYKNFAVQELEITVKKIIYKLEVWQAANGKVFRAKLPEELKRKHFGIELQNLVINLYTQGMTQPAIYEFLRGVGIKISPAQVNNILLEVANKFSKISETILETGLKEASYIRVDDTGARHKHKNGYCTCIGGQYFAYYKTTFRKSRRNFLEILRQSKEGYRINEAMIWHLYQFGAEDDVLNIFERNKGKKFKTKKGLNRFLNSICLYSKKLRDKCLEAAEVGFISEEILKNGQVLLSDRAGQFTVFDHAACWIHMERPLRKITVSSKKVKKELNQVREAIWRLYNKLKEFALTKLGRESIETQYDALINMHSISPAITQVINNFRNYRKEMLKVLDHPNLPLHNNDTERDIRYIVKQRKISGSTKSERGKKLRDSLASIKQTCMHLHISFWEYSKKWLLGKPPDLAQIIREKYQTNFT